jgi:hypothetical protein
MNAARNHAADAGDQFGLLADGDDASGCADDVDDVALAATRAERIPVRVECADGDGNARAEAQLRSPLGREMTGKVIGGLIVAGELFANAVEERV